MPPKTLTTLTRWMAAAATCLALTAHAADGFDAGDWKHTLKTLIDSSPEGVELKQGASQVPIALRLHSGNFSFAEAKPDGSDLRVTAADGKTPLRFHLEKYDPANELAVVWTQLPKLSPSSKANAIVLHWGNPKATPAADSTATYDVSQTLVLHFSDPGPARDATVNGNHPRDFTPTPAAGPLGDAAALDGGNGLVVPATPSLRLIPANGFTFSAWIKPTVLSGVLLQQIEGGKGIAIGLNGGKLSAVVNGKETLARTPLQVGNWQHVAVTLLGSRLVFYINGEEAGSGEVAASDTGGDVQIGARFRGEMDELTLAAAARSGDYIKALYGSQQPDSPMLTVDDEGAGGESASYLGILLGAVTVDGWVVIGILAVMGIVSFGVMVGKTRFLARVKGANTAFLARFRQQAAALLDPDTAEFKAVGEDRGVAHSPIYRLYRIGMDEIHQRFQTRGRGDGLSAASLDAIRAAMDAGMVRENQRLNSQIVLLTIAISGGPFLGLLGTVVGVMITFAAIAAAGDVNVNSIAPGIAAALVATVAGLAVAIPALFGYNWLAIQIKNVSADTQVFADEFLTRAAELHSR